MASILTLTTGLNAILECAGSDFFIAIAMDPWIVRTLADSAMLFEAMAGPAPLDTRYATAHIPRQIATDPLRFRSIVSNDTMSQQALDAHLRTQHIVEKPYASDQLHG